MNRDKTHWWLAGASATFLSLALSSCDGGASSDKLNLLLITIDTTRADALSCYGAKSGTTPTLDRFAEEALLFERAYSATNVTKPSHLSIMTGSRAIEHRVFNNQVLIPETVDALPLFMEREGYRTGAFVAAVQLGEETGWRGFETVKGPPKGKSQRVGKEVVDETLAWLREDDDRPFFAWTHFFDPHTLYTPPKKFARRFYKGDPTEGDEPLISDAAWFDGWDYKPMQNWIKGVRDPAFAKAMYAAELAYTDQQIGRLFAYLEQSELTDKTVIVVTADHGEHFGEHGLYYDHTGLYETALHIPLIVRVPGSPTALSGARSTELVSQLDIVPTLQELFALRVGHPTAGTSLVPLIMNEPNAFASRDSLIFESAHNHQIAMRKDKWKLIMPIELSHRFLGTEPELFDLSVDPGEMNNLASEFPEVVEQLSSELSPWILTGTISKGELREMSDEVQAGLEELGYVGDE